VCHKVSVKCDGGDNVSLNAENEDTFAPLLTSVRTLQSWERVASDFSKKETVSEILKQLGCNGKNLNEVDLRTVIKCVEKFSSFEHSAEADEPFTDKVHVLNVTVDVDSVCTTFKRRVLSSAQPKDIANILQAIDSVFKDDPTFFINTTSFKPNVKSLKQIPTEIKKYGPTIERSKVGYFRIKLPAPMGPEVFNIWLYAPKKMKNFVAAVQTIANECAKALAQKFQSTMLSALESAIDGKLVGFRAFDIPGGYAFPISIALVMCEQHQECRFTVETYNCKKKGFRFDASTNTFGSESWSADLVAKMKEFIKKCPTMMKLFCRLDRIAQVVPEDSTIGFGFEMKYTDLLSNRLYSVCKPNIDDCDKIIVYPLAFLPKEMASRLSFLKNGDRIQTYMPAWHQANWRRNQQKDVSNLGLRHCIVRGRESSLQMNVTELLRGAKREQIMVDDVLQRFRNGFCERIEIATSWSFSKDSAHGPMCFFGSEASVSNGCTRWLDLKTMIRKCAGYVDKHTQFWSIGPITDYMTLNFAAAFAMYHLSARAMADTTLASMEREQCCRTLVYINQLLKLAKDGKLWQHNQQSKLTLLTRGERHNREMMLPSCPSRIYKILAEAGGIVLERISTVLPFTSQEVMTTSTDLVQMIDDRIRENKCSKNNFGTNVLRCRTCGQCFYGGKGINDNQLFKQHFTEHPDHAIGPTNGEKISNAQWYSDYKTRESDITFKYQTLYDSSQKRAYDAIFREQKSALLLGIAGSGKTMIVQDLLHMLRSLFWRKNEVRVCGATHAVSQRMEHQQASTFHSFLGIRCDYDDTGLRQWDFSVDEYLQKIRLHSKNKQSKLASVRVLVLDEGLEVPSNLMEAYFRYIKEARLNIISIIAGDVCQGAYREDQETGRTENSFFSNSIKLADLCPSLKIITFTEDHRTKCAALKSVKEKIRNAVADAHTEAYIRAHQYKNNQTNVDIVLCARIKDMFKHNANFLTRNQTIQMVYKASKTHGQSYGRDYPLTYKYNGVEDKIALKIGVPVMITQTCVTACGQQLRNGTLGNVVGLSDVFVTIQCSQDQFRIEPVKIFDTMWIQLPLCVAYAGTIAKCIGFEFNSVAIDFGMTLREDGSALWRQKQAYTAISRAKQECYFVGNPPLSLLNNMDMDSLMFFKNALVSNQQLAREVQIVRNVFEMSEFWVNQTRSSQNKRVQSEIDIHTNQEQIIKKRFNCGKTIEGVTVDDKQINVVADVYPNCFQILINKGYILRATSKDHKELLLKRKESHLDQDCKLEIDVLKTCSDMLSVLKIVATVDRGILLEQMKDRVSFMDFSNSSIPEAKQAFCQNLKLLVQTLNQRNIAHKNISHQTAWVNIHGAIKLTWFQDAEFPATAASLQKDRDDAAQLCKLLIPETQFCWTTAFNGINGDTAEETLNLDSLNPPFFTTSAPASSPSLSRALTLAPALAAAAASAHAPAPDPEAVLSSKRQLQSASGSAKRPVHKPAPDFHVSLQHRQSVKNVDEKAWFPRRHEHYTDPNLTQTLADLLSTSRDSVKVPRLFRCSKIGHPDTYGEVTPELVKFMMQQYDQLVGKTSEYNTTFVDLGSGIGSLVCFVAGLRRFKACFGVENEPNRASYADPLVKDFLGRLQRRSMRYSDIHIRFGDFFKCDTTLNYLQRASLVWVNNVAFASINFQLLTILDKHVPIGCVVLSFVSFLPNLDCRNDSGFEKILEYELKEAADWTGTPQKVHVMQKKRTQVTRSFH
jgi:hypothetical protein